MAGFIFDILFIAEVDDPLATLQQVVYLGLAGGCLYYEIIFNAKVWNPPARLERIWNYRNLILHFSLGSLLNVCSLFYIKSASLLNSLLFLILMLSVILANELGLGLGLGLKRLTNLGRMSKPMTSLLKGKLPILPMFF